ncbi:MAG: hypothetical protein ACOC07_14940 [Coleofasciculus sp.]
MWLFDCTNGNPNGDPDADNTPTLNTKSRLATPVIIQSA